MADVSGKGLEAEHLANTTFGAVRKARREGEPLPRIAAAANEALERISEAGMFATMLLAHIDTHSLHMELVVVGHLPPLVVPADEDKPPYLLPVSERNVPIGALRGEETREYVSESHRLEAGSRLLFYSDGVTERRDDSGELLGEEGLVSFVEGSRTLAPLPFIHDLLRQVADRSNAPLQDDATAVMVQMKS